MRRYDGELANQLTHPRFEVPKTYRARVAAAACAETALQRLRAGIELDDGRPRRRACAASRREIEIIMHEGRKRQVRRMLEAVGHPVIELRRVAFGPLHLGGLAPGARPPAAPARSRLRAPRRRRSSDGAPRAMRLFALRGATTVDRNDAEAILGATEWLMREIIKRNDLAPDDVVSCIFTLTDDLDAEFPAVAARQLGFDARAAAVRARDPGARLAAARHPRAHALLRRRRPRDQARLPRRRAQAARRPRAPRQ